MLFNSIQFLIFFPLIILLYFIMPSRFKIYLLFIASIYFYMSFIPKYILILFLLIGIDYLAGIFIEKSTGKKRKIYLIISLLSTCLVLFIFKYFNFVNSNFASLAEVIHWNYSIQRLSLILPIGLSFHTFQSLSYVIEVYKGRYNAEKNIIVYSVYVLFFPQLVAGPIERPYNLIHQFKEEHKFDIYRIVDGLKLMLIGFFKKVAIADRLALVADMIFNHARDYTGIPLIVGVVFFGFQIYCDFSGYTDIARGTARVMGFGLMENFRSPYLARSIRDFWRRWHISLMTWFKDYVYIPLGGNRVKVNRWYLNIFIIFLISGLWHGANWTFLIWGAVHGVYQIFGIITDPYRLKIKQKLKITNFPKINTLMQILITFILVDIAWIFFRANSLSDAIYILTHLFINWSLSFPVRHINLGGWPGLFLACFLILLIEIIDYIKEKRGLRDFESKMPKLLKWIVYLSIILYILLFGMFNSAKFIYFQF